MYGSRQMSGVRPSFSRRSSRDRYRHWRRYERSALLEALCDRLGRRAVLAHDPGDLPLVVVQGQVRAEPVGGFAGGTLNVLLAAP